MISKSVTAILRAARELFLNWPAVAIMAATYGVLLTGGYFFVTTKEATPMQVIITASLSLLIPVLFFILQTAGTTYSTRVTAKTLIGGSIKNCWKLCVVTLPVIAISVLGVYLLARLQTYLSFGTWANPSDPIAITHATQTQAIQSSTQWGIVAILSLKYLLIGLFTPLALIHLWIAANHTGPKQTLKRFLPHLTKSCAARSVLIYLAGFVVFALVPYFVLFKTTTTRSGWLEIGLLATRLALVFCLTLFGWIVTIGALTLAEESGAQITEDA